MSHTQPAIHPTAVIDPLAELAEDVAVGPYAVIEGPVALGPGCVVRPHAHLIGPLTLGPGNYVGTGAVIGDAPQHLKYEGGGRTEVGAHNVFREHVTVHRSTGSTPATFIGDHNYFMAHSHVAHDCLVGNHCIFANGALLAGHVEVGDRVFLSGNTAVHQFMRVGKLAMLSGGATQSKDTPPFIMHEGRNTAVGVNIVGMRRAGYSHAEIAAVRRAYHVLYQQGNVLPKALADLQAEFGHVGAVAELITFLRASKTGLCKARDGLRALDSLADAA